MPPSALRPEVRVGLVLALLWGAADLALAAPERWSARADPEASGVRFEVGATLHTVRGTGRLRSAEIAFDPASGVAEGRVEVEVASLTTGHRARDRAMHARVLESERYPTLAFRAERLEGAPAAQGASSFVIAGRLLLHGLEHALAVPVDIIVDGERFRAAAAFSVPYVEWGLRDPSRLLLKVEKRVEVAVELVGELERTRPELGRLEGEGALLGGFCDRLARPRGGGRR